MSTPDEADHQPPFVGGQIAALSRRIGTTNRPGNLDGLLARYLLGDTVPLGWNVDPLTGHWLADNRHRLGEPAALAVLGYAHRPSSQQHAAALPIPAPVDEQLITGLRRLMQRNLFPGDRLSVLHDVRILFGLGLAIESTADRLPQATAWLCATLTDSRLQPADQFHHLAQQHVYARLTGQPVPLTAIGEFTGREHTLAYWMINQGTAALAHPVVEAGALARHAMHAALITDPADVALPEVALALWVASHIVDASIDQLVLQRSHVSQVLRRFEPAMRRWRWDSDTLQHPIRWEIRSEREVQDILWIMLRSVFDDVVDEETLPKFGHKSYKPDFGLPRLRVLVEAKYIRTGTDEEFKQIENQVMIDSVGYLKSSDRYEEIVVFVYDESASVEHHDLTRRTLLQLNGVTEVIIVSRPGRLPIPTRTPGSIATKPRRRSPGGRQRKAS